MIRLLSGNEAVARGAWEAGAAVASAYPGTPSTEILEEFARFPNVYAEWATNEKVAVDVAVGAAYMGRRAFAAMKHVGLNVAADAFMYASMTGAEAGLVIISADDPGMHSSQNEQDNRTFARFARIPCLEPSDSQEAKDFTVAAFELSERFDTPVLLRLTTRICHSTSAVELGEDERFKIEENDFDNLQSSIFNLQSDSRFPSNPTKYIMVPGQRAAPPPRHRTAHPGCCCGRGGLARQPRRAGRPQPGHHHRGDCLPVRQRGLPVGVRAEAGHVPGCCPNGCSATSPRRWTG